LRQVHRQADEDEELDESVDEDQGPILWNEFSAENFLDTTSVTERTASKNYR
jgi:hypothetical protein